MLNPLSLPDYHPLRRALGTLLVCAFATILAVGGPQHLRGIKARLDELLYDAAYALRSPERPINPSVAVIAIDDTDLRFMREFRQLGSPWPRQLWAEVLWYLDQCRPAAVAFDLQFSEPSIYEQSQPDDEIFTNAINAARVPVVLAFKIGPDGKREEIAIQPKRCLPGIVTHRGSTILREYDAPGNDDISLACAALKAAGRRIPSWADAAFRLHFYGPFAIENPTLRTRPSRATPLTTAPSATTTLPYYRASLVWLRATSDFGRRPDAKPEERPLAEEALAELKRQNLESSIRPEFFRDKIVLIGATAAGLFDVYSSPLSKQYPAVDMHATAIENMLRGDRVIQAPQWVILLAAATTALLVAAGTIFARSMLWKFVIAALVLVLLVVKAMIAFHARQIYWLPLSSPLIAGGLALVGGFGRCYLTEDARRRFMTRALNQYVSPEVSSRLERDPALLKIDAEQRVMTAMFTDLKGFTDFTELADIRVLTIVLNAYMEKMSSIVLAEGGTIDKYIGDAIMAFWNAPIPQKDHELAACRAALRICRAETELRESLMNRLDELRTLQGDHADKWPQVQRSIERMGIDALYTRIGINTGPMNVGNWGSSRKFQYTVTGDAVNTAARLEPANKRYGTRIMLSQSTAAAARTQFLARRLDVVRVQGKATALTVFELVDFAPGDETAQRCVRRYEEAFDLYQKRCWDQAAALLEANIHDHDKPSHELLARIAEFRIHPPPLDWDGSFKVEK